MNQVQILLYYRRLTQLRLGIVCSINCRLTQPAITKGCCYCYMINKKVHFSLDNTIIDPDGRCGIVNTVYQFKVVTYVLQASVVQMLLTPPFFTFFLLKLRTYKRGFQPPLQLRDRQAQYSRHTAEVAIGGYFQTVQE